MVINRKLLKKVIIFQIVYIMIVQFLVSEFHWPSFICYLPDFLNVLLFVFLIIQKNPLNVVRRLKGQVVLNSLYLLSVILLIGCIINFVPIKLTFWAIRNTYRFFIFFIACIFVLDSEDIDFIFKILVSLQIPNFILSIFQFFVQGKEQDFLGGIFGISVGCNASTNVYFCVILIWVIVRYIYKKEKITMVIWISISTLVIAALAELKIFFIEFLVIVVLAILFSKPSIRKYKIMMFSIIGLFVGLYLFQKVFPDAYETLINLNKAIEYNTTVIWGYNISRIGAFRQINELFFHNNIIKNLFGMGFGNCEYSSIEFLTSEFYKMYGSYHYRWFAHQMWFIECGYLGFSAFVFFFISILIWGKKLKNVMKEKHEYLVFLTIFIIITIPGLWYNAAIRTDIAYLTFFALAAPFVVAKNEINN